MPLSLLLGSSFLTREEAEALGWLEAPEEEEEETAGEWRQAEVVMGLSPRPRVVKGTAGKKETASPDAVQAEE